MALSTDLRCTQWQRREQRANRQDPFRFEFSQFPPHLWHCHEDYLFQSSVTREHSSTSAAIVVGATTASPGPQDSYIVDRRCLIGDHRSFACPAMARRIPTTAHIGGSVLDRFGRLVLGDAGGSGESGDGYGEPGENRMVEAVPGPYVRSDGSNDIGVPKNAEMI